MSSFHEEDWERRKTYLIRSLFQDVPLLSPIPEDQESAVGTGAAEAPPGSPSCRPYSPLPPLIIERAPNRHDHPKQYYDELERKMKKVYRSLFYDERYSSVEDLIEFNTGDHSYMIDQLEKSTELSNLRALCEENFDAGNLNASGVTRAIPTKKSTDENNYNTTESSKPDDSEEKQSNRCQSTLSSIELEATTVTAEVEVHLAPAAHRQGTQLSAESEDSLLVTEEINVQKTLSDRKESPCNQNDTYSTHSQIDEDTVPIEKETDVDPSPTNREGQTCPNQSITSSIRSRDTVHIREEFEEQQHDENITSASPDDPEPFTEGVEVPDRGKNLAIQEPMSEEDVTSVFTHSEMNIATLEDPEEHQYSFVIEGPQSPILGSSHAGFYNRHNFDELADEEAQEESSSKSHKHSDSSKSESQPEEKDEESKSEGTQESIEVMRRRITASCSGSFQKEPVDTDSNISSLGFDYEKINHRRLSRLFSENYDDFQEILTASTPTIDPKSTKEMGSPTLRKRASDEEVYPGDGLVTKKNRMEETAVQTSFTSENEPTTWDMLKNNFFIGLPKIYKLCSCKDHSCQNTGEI